MVRRPVKYLLTQIGRLHPGWPSKWTLTVQGAELVQLYSENSYIEKFVYIVTLNILTYLHFTVQNMKYNMYKKFNKCDQISSFLLIWWPFSEENFIFCAVFDINLKTYNKIMSQIFWRKLNILTIHIHLHYSTLFFVGLYIYLFIYFHYFTVKLLLLPSFVISIVTFLDRIVLPIFLSACSRSEIS